MIIVCAGDSFTAGAELWEEKNVPGYTLITDPYEAYKIIRSISNDNDLERRDLTYSGHLKNILCCEVLNLGISGASQLEILQNLCVALNKIRKNNPNESILCIHQMTEKYRLWLYNNIYNKNFSIIIPSIIETHHGDKLEAYEIQNVCIDFIDERILEDNYYLQILAVKYVCNILNIDFLEFKLLQQEEIQNDLSINWFYDKLGTTEVLLPSGHLNCEAHKHIAEWLIDKMKNGTLCPVFITYET
jgi:hypothetical protein